MRVEVQRSYNTIRTNRSENECVQGSIIVPQQRSLIPASPTEQSQAKPVLPRARCEGKQARATTLSPHETKGKVPLLLRRIGTHGHKSTARQRIRANLLDPQHHRAQNRSMEFDQTRRPKEVMPREKVDFQVEVASGTGWLGEVGAMNDSSPQTRPYGVKQSGPQKDRYIALRVSCVHAYPRETTAVSFGRKISVQPASRNDADDVHFVLCERGNRHQSQARRGG